MTKLSTKKLVTVLAAILVATIAAAHASPVVLQGGKDVTPDVVLQGGDKHVEPSVVLQRRTPVVLQGGKDVTPDVVLQGDKKNADPEYWNDPGACSGRGRWGKLCY
ncbi:hypothetical protein GGF31_000860 [Allomyces arbusculus]|nr:hypothetical protein GGF31_000860 [Allomyces arbusculus]